MILCQRHAVLALSLIIALAALCPLAAQDADAPVATVSDIAGKVEYKAGSKAWAPLKVGMVVDRGTIISTGFKSTATIQLGEDSITVKPVTRLSLEELIKTDGGTSTKLYLTVGRVKADVNPKKREKVEFSIKSATATASVRGTGFETDGVNLVVSHGVVQLENNWGQFRYVGGGEYSKVDNDNTITIPVAMNPETGLESLAEITAQAEQELGASQTPKTDATSVSVPTGVETTDLVLTLQ